MYTVKGVLVYVLVLWCNYMSHGNLHSNGLEINNAATQ